VLLPSNAQPARLIVCERTGRWAIALHRELGTMAFGVYQTRHLNDCRAELIQAPASFIVVELPVEGREAVLEQIAQFLLDFPLARVAVVADSSLECYQWLAREAGAVHFSCSQRQARLLAGIALRHLAYSPSPPQTFTQQLWASLPWPRAAAR
jgi:hypothetical protein